ncbi:MAG: hypothetical protein ACLUKN_16075 [Bacilli bacterium]
MYIENTALKPRVQRTKSRCADGRNQLEKPVGQCPLAHDAAYKLSF